MVAIEPGIYLEFRLFRPVEDKYVEETSILKTMSNVVLCIYIDIVAPEHAVRVADGCYRGVPLIYVPYELVKPYIEKWVSLLTSWQVPTEVIYKHEIGLIIRAFIINDTDGRILYDVHDSIPLTLGDFMKPQAIHYVVAIRQGVYQVVYEKTIMKAGRPSDYVNIALNEHKLPLSREYELISRSNT